MCFVVSFVHAPFYALFLFLSHYFVGWIFRCIVLIIMKMFLCLLYILILGMFSRNIKVLTNSCDNFEIFSYSPKVYPVHQMKNPMIVTILVVVNMVIQSMVSFISIQNNMISHYSLLALLIWNITFLLRHVF